MIKSVGDKYGIWKDENNNTWLKCNFSKQDAEEHSKSLINCKNCLDCINCKECKDCIRCNKCINCDNCKDCYNCENCEDCCSCEECGCLDGAKYMTEENTKSFINWLKSKNKIDN